MSGYTANTQLQSIINLSISTSRVQISRSPHSESQADCMSVTIICLHVCKALHSNKKCERVSSASPEITCSIGFELIVACFVAL